ncbi:MAG: RNA pyrophosphohydrolase [Gammaproteobacteria bacterium]
MIDQSGLRLNVGIILANQQNQLFWGRRAGALEIWQFPQGGIQQPETPEQAMYRELREELGLRPEDIKILGVTRNWLSYYLPKHLRRTHTKPFCIGQKQKWFMLRLLSDEAAIHFDATDYPEFSDWRWVDYWYPVQQVITFKKSVYKRALEELESFIKE